MFLYPKNYKEVTNPLPSDNDEEILVEARKYVKDKPVQVKEMLDKLEQQFAKQNIHLSSDRLREIALTMLAEFPMPVEEVVEPVLAEFPMPVEEVVEPVLDPKVG